MNDYLSTGARSTDRSVGNASIHQLLKMINENGHMTNKLLVSCRDTTSELIQTINKLVTSKASTCTSPTEEQRIKTVVSPSNEF
jgi:hypothetical protein